MRSKFILYFLLAVCSFIVVALMFCMTTKTLFNYALLSLLLLSFVAVFISTLKD